MKYELFYLIGSTKEAGLENIKKDVRQIVEKDVGVFEEKETVEKRRMSYEIKHETHGIYVAQRFEIDSEKIDNIIKKMNLNSGVLRFVLSRVSELPPLKTREERLEEAKKGAPIKKIEVKKDRKEKSAEKEDRPKKEETQEDIDKKLEEILNI